MAEQRTGYKGIFKTDKGEYKVRFRLPNGAARSKTLPTLKEAKAFQAAQRNAKSVGQMTDPKAGRMTLGEYARTKWYPSKVKDRRIKRRTLTNLRTRVGLDRDGTQRGPGHYGSLSGMRVQAITYSDIEDWRNDFHETHAASTVNDSLGTLNQILNRARRDRLIAHNPCVDVDPLETGTPRLIIPATPAQIRLLADAHPDRYRAAILVAAFTGMRAGELWALHRDRVNELKSTIEIVEGVGEDGGELVTGDTKTRETRTIRVDRETMRLITDQLQRYPSESGLVFTTSRGCQIRHSNFKEDWYVPIVKSLGEAIPSGAVFREGVATPVAFRFHDLRHSHASHLIARGASLQDVADRLGHASVKTTERWYRHLYPDHDAHLVGLLGDLTRETLGEAVSR